MPLESSSHLVRGSRADDLISSSPSRARSGRGRDERHRNETKKKQKKNFFYAAHNAGSHHLSIATSEALNHRDALGCTHDAVGAWHRRAFGVQGSEPSTQVRESTPVQNTAWGENEGRLGCDSSRRPGSVVRFSLGCETFSKRDAWRIDWR